LNLTTIYSMFIKRYIYSCMLLINDVM